MRAISLFSGCGGLDLGLLRAGIDIVWANDNDDDAVATYTRNIGNHIVREDICGIDARGIPDAELVVGGFPCQGFSCANLRRTASDERNALYLQFIRILRVKQTPMFLAENVRGILSLEGGKVVEMILKDFSELGYSVTMRTFNLADYGVPQIRKRVIFVGIRKDLVKSIQFEFPRATHGQSVPERCLKPWMSIGEALRGIPEPTSRGHGLSNHVCSLYKVTNRNFTGHRRTDPNKPSPTILARGNGQGGVCALQHPKNHRRMSVRETAIVQTFPRSFTFSGGLNSMYRQVGNAVPPLFAQQLGTQLVKAWQVSKKPKLKKSVTA
jgi:DNA (cytosine-5)-methyltransferase 1